MSVPYQKPVYKKSDFNCPYCHAYAHQEWHKMIHYTHSEVLPSYEEYDTSKEITPEDRVRFAKGVGTHSGEPPHYPANIYIPTTEVSDASLSKCARCNQYAFWIRDKIVYPVVSLAPQPSDDMPDDAKADYMEAASIVEASPRSSSALLRLSLQKIMIHIGETGDLNNDIKKLVKSGGLPEKIQKSLDAVRVIGNESVHPGELNLKDDKETAYFLFDLVNIIVDDRITRPNKIDVFYDNLPQNKLDWIKNRDSK